MSDVKVAIVGAGLAGLTAALRLLERDCHVILIEQDDFIGGKWGSHQTSPSSPYHEHSYHMMLNWFNNFWQLTHDIGLTREESFEPRTELKYLRLGEFPHMTEVTNVGLPSTLWENVMSGVEPPADMFIYLYSLIDILAQPFSRHEFLDNYSVNGFMHSRLYATNPAAIMHQRTLAKAFASPSYQTSAQTYKNYIKYGARLPAPMLWVLKGNSYTAYLQYLERHLKQFGAKFDLRLLNRVDKLHLKDGRVREMETSIMPASPTVHEIDPKLIKKGPTITDIDYAILAVPPKALGKLIDKEVYDADPKLANVRKLRSEPMASLDLYFTKKLPDIPKSHVILVDSPYTLTFIDNSQIWPDEPTTFLNVVASDFDPLVGLPVNDVRDLLIKELNRYLPFDPVNDIDFDRTHLQTNTGEELFVSEVGSWQSRPTTTCQIPNLYIAGDFCQNIIAVVTLESAVVSGLLAAQALQSQAIADRKAPPEAPLCRPIDIIEPESYPEADMAVLKALWAPYAYAAKWWASTGGEMLSAFQEMFPPTKR